MPTPLQVYRRFRSLLSQGDFEHMSEVVDLEAYTEICVGITEWTTGFGAAVANFQRFFGSAFRDFTSTEIDTVESADALVLRTRIDATHIGPFLGHAATNRPVSWAALDFLRFKNDRIVWRYLMSDWRGLEQSLTALSAAAQ